MKRFLIVSLIALLSTSAFAQKVNLDRGGKMQNSVLTKKISSPLTMSAQSAVATTPQHRTKANGVYYYKPAGSLYENYFYPEDDYGSDIRTFLAVAPWATSTFINKSASATDCHWTIDGDNWDDYADSEGNLSVYFQYPGYAFSLPFVSNPSNTISYTMDADYYDDVYGGYNGYFYISTDVEWLGFLNNKDWSLWGSMENGNVAGSGTTNINGVLYTCTELYQTYPAPASPLYVESISVVGSIVLSGSQPLNNGAELTMEIYNSDTNELVETLTATADDYEFWFSGERGGSYGTPLLSVDVGTLRFTKKVDNPIWGIEEEAIVIDYPSTVYIKGFENDNVNFGVAGWSIYDCDDREYLSDLHLIAENGDDAYDVWYEDVAMNIFLNSIMDKVMVSDALTFSDGYSGSGYSILQISDDGKTCSTYGQVPDSNHDLGGVFAETVCDWYTEDYNENYYADDVPEWITGINVDTQYYNPEPDDGSEPTYYNIVSFEAESLPAGTTGRSAMFRLVGRGYTDTTYIRIVQGDAEVPTVPEGINAVLAPTATKYVGTYNLSGQRVAESTKGIVIQNGKKVLNK